MIPHNLSTLGEVASVNVFSELGITAGNVLCRKSLSVDRAQSFDVNKKRSSKRASAKAIEACNTPTLKWRPGPRFANDLNVY